MKNTVTTEFEGILEEVNLADIKEYLSGIANISNGVEDFIEKVQYGLTDETSKMSQDNQSKLEHWYLYN
mgnify:CR=1 FL=1|tara:strand:+ start:291 stop:497 length:207 start_codon:yes stop_codon:yes gene_type:complete